MIKHNNFQVTDIDFPVQFSFNQDFIWKEVEHSIVKIISYLKDNKIGIEIRDAYQNKNEEITNVERLKAIILILDKALLDNKSEYLNVFFIEFYRLCAIYLYCTDNKIKTYEIIEKFLYLINEYLRLNEDEMKDINLLVERDKLDLNKAQMLFWEEKYEEAEGIIYDKLAYFQNESTDELYVLKMTNFYISILVYKAWINVFNKDNIEAEKSFLLAIQILRDYKHLILQKFEDPNIKELYKRKVKILHQYINFTMNRLKETKNKLSSHTYLEISTKALKEIIKLLHKDNFEFDDDINKSYIIYYYLYGCVMALRNINEKNQLDIETPILYLSYALVQNSTQHITYKAKYNIFMFKNLLILCDLIMTEGKLANLTNNEMVIKELKLMDHKIEKIMMNFYENGKHPIEENAHLYSIFQEYLYNSKTINNYCLSNIERFSDHTMKQPIKDLIDEIYVVNYISDKFLFVLGKVIQDSKEFINLFSENLTVLESLNGYMVIEENNIILFLKNSFFIDYQPSETENDSSQNDKYLANNIFSNLIVEKSEQLLHFYNRHKFIIKKDASFDLYSLLTMINILYSLNLYKPCITIVSYILTEFEKVKSTFCTVNLNKSTRPYLEFYLFLSMFVVKIYLKLNEYSLALKQLDEIADFENEEYTHILYNILTGVCLTKIRYSDLASVYMDKALIICERALTEENLKYSNEAGQVLERKVDPNKISESNHNIII